jgi:DNA-binding response OmpR family regulator
MQAENPCAFLAQPATNEMLSIAFVESRNPRLTALRSELDGLGHVSALYDRPCDLLEALYIDLRFDLLILADDEEQDWRELLRLCQTPVMLLVRKFNRARMPPGTRDFLQAGGLLDVVAWPVSEDELIWRIHALQHRAGRPSSSSSSSPSIEVHDLVWQHYHFMVDQKRVMLRGREVRMTPCEIRLALLLFRHLGRPLTRAWLLNELSLGDSSRVLDVRMSMLRSKLQLRGENGLMLRAMYREGYQLAVLQPNLTDAGTTRW